MVLSMAATFVGCALLATGVAGALAPVTLLSSDEVVGFTYGTPPNTSKILGLDFDGTIGFASAFEVVNQTWTPSEGQQTCRETELVTPGTEHVWWWGYSKWNFTFPDAVPSTIKQYHSLGYKIVIMSNQYVLSHQFSDKWDLPPVVKQKSWVDKLIQVADAITEAAGEVIPMLVMGSLYQDNYEKPCPGMWEVARQHNGDVDFDCQSSWYIGDADGRVRDSSTSFTGADFAASDFQFAITGGVNYKTPQQFFLGESAPSTDNLNECMRLPYYTWCGEHETKWWCGDGGIAAPPQGLYKTLSNGKRIRVR